MKAPLLTFVTITKDDPAGLARTLESTLRWRREESVEHLVIHAGAPLEQQPAGGVRLIEQRSSGISSAFNEGWREARGEWVWFINGGDAVHEALAPEWLLFFLQQAAKADVIMGGVVYDQDGETRLHPAVCRQWPLVDSWISHPSSIIRRSRFLRDGGFDESYQIAMDFDWWLRVLCEGARFDLVSVPLARFARGGLSQRFETRHQLSLERAKVLRSHQWKVWRLLSRQVVRFTFQGLKAAVRRLDRGGTRG